MRSALTTRQSTLSLLTGLVAAAMLSLMATTASAQVGPPIGGPAPPPLPYITGFGGVNVIADTWVFTGSVDGCDEIAGVSINFGGLVTGSTTTASDGSFTLVTTVPQGSNGTVFTEATCHHGYTSSRAYYLIDAAGG